MIRWKSSPESLFRPSKFAVARARRVGFCFGDPGEMRRISFCDIGARTAAERGLRGIDWTAAADKNASTSPAVLLNIIAI